MKLPNNYGQICKLSGNRRRPLACLAALSGSISDTMTLRIGGLSNSSFTVTLSRSNTQGAGLYFFAFGI